MSAEIAKASNIAIALANIHVDEHLADNNGHHTNADDDAIMEAVFKKISLPEVRFVNGGGENIDDSTQTIDDSTTPPPSPNSVRREQDATVAEPPATPPRRSLIAQRQQTPRHAKDIGAELQEVAEMEERSAYEGKSPCVLGSMSPDDDSNCQSPSEIIVNGILLSDSRRSSVSVQGDEVEDEIDDEASVTRFSVGNIPAVQHNTRHRTSTLTELRDFQSKMTDESKPEAVKDEQLEAERNLYREMYQEAMEKAINSLNNHRPDDPAPDYKEESNDSQLNIYTYTHAHPEGESTQDLPHEELHEAPKNEGTLLQRRQKDAFQLELHHKIERQQSMDMDDDSAEIADQRSLTPQKQPPREIIVRTPLSDDHPDSPMNRHGFSPFEPDRQEQIRKEMGRKTNIRGLLNRFQGSNFDASQQDYEEEVEEPVSKEPLIRQKSAHFVVPKIELAEDTTETKSIGREPTPHPTASNRKSLPMESPKVQIINEAQKPVSELLSKFDNSKSPLGRNHPDSLKNGRNGGSASIFRTNNSYVVKNYGNGGDHRRSNGEDPPIGSVAAIRKSLGSVPTTPVKTPTSPSPTADFKLITSIPNTANHPNSSAEGSHPETPVKTPQTPPKNVREFFRIWGAGQAATANKLPQNKASSPVSTNGNGNVSPIGQ